MPGMPFETGLPEALLLANRHHSTADQQAFLMQRFRPDSELMA